jgi:pyruvate dehydrogenase E2 component (dihydrolipoamide acetyltransferase)
MSFKFKLPDIGEGVVEGEIVSWFVKEGDSVEEDQPLVEIMTDKVTVEIPSPRNGKITERIGEEGQIIEVGTTLVVIAESETDTVNKTVRVKSKTQDGEKPGVIPPKEIKHFNDADVLATPAIRKLAHQMGIDLTEIKGTGSGGRIVQEDLHQYHNNQANTPEDTETIPYRGLRRKIGSQLLLSKKTMPHYTYVEEVDVTELVILKTKLQKTHKDVRLTYLPFVMKAVAAGLKQYPLLNSTLDEEAEVIQLQKRFNLGIATAAPEGLIVPVVKDVDTKNVLQLAKEISDLTELARAGKTKLEDLQGGTFTLTSLGTLGGIAATPIINLSQVAILGINKISQKPVVRNGQIVIRNMMNLSISLDHRVVDGIVAAEFLHHVIHLLEDPNELH